MPGFDYLTEGLKTLSDKTVFDYGTRKGGQWAARISSYNALAHFASTFAVIQRVGRGKDSKSTGY